MLSPSKPLKQDDEHVVKGTLKYEGGRPSGGPSWHARREQRRPEPTVDGANSPNRPTKPALLGPVSEDEQAYLLLNLDVRNYRPGVAAEMDSL